MDKDIIVKLEELVESVSECYTSIPIETVEELNELTKNNWIAEEYIEYCAEYWSRSTLEETVYALLHEGEYPENIDKELFLWKNREKVDLLDEKIIFTLRKLPEVADVICEKFDDLPIEELCNWSRVFFENWSVDKEVSAEDLKKGTFKLIYNYNNITEYAKYKSIILKVYGKKLISFNCCNLSENERQDIIAFANKHGLYVYEN